MNDTNIDLATTGRQTTGTRKKKGSTAFLVFLGIWIILIGGGIFGAKLYTDQMQKEITADIEKQTAAQVAALQKAYEERLGQLETSYKADITDLKGKVDALNELLTFTKDNADNKTDNSNKLYTQLNEVKKQLNELKKSLDVLK
ncbi:hypothetical protein I6N90_14390 [Paenibacillus sp. GSMTC-2017]|uniref:hypothetical protein n=1 Tax=Paenibacillus sp. GSMTC-2017 TaxID=2794350 RepID=UPI0018D75E62|nr:hypothetical protein [Paenibacillus sp. GSMTC-2017]MBH5318991.1 hypothetical protein [Paenibacillus sp. GSMTC-2017]